MQLALTRAQVANGAVSRPQGSRLACQRAGGAPAARASSGLRAGPQALVAVPVVLTALAPTVCRAYATEAEEGSADLAESRSIFVANMAWATDSEGLADHISGAGLGGGLLRVNVLSRDGRSRGIAIADFDSPDAARAAVEALNETELDGRTLSVRISEPRPPRADRGDRPPRGDRYGADRGDRAPRGDRYGSERAPRGDRYGSEPREPRAPRDPETLLYVGNLSWGTEWQEVRDAFSSAGHPVAFADVKKDASGRSRGFAIVAMNDPDSAQAAVDALDQSELGGRRLNVRRFNRDRPAAGGDE